MADRWTVFSSAVKHCLEGWPALHIAQQQGFGGDNFREKLEWLFDVIVQTFQGNDHIYPDELQEYIAECLFNEFDIIVDDGTCPKIAEKLCHFDMMCQTGQFAKVMDELRVPPPSCPPIAKATDDAESDDECQESAANNQSSNNLMEETVQNQASLSSQENMDTDQTTPMDEDGDGWEVVRRSKKKPDIRKST